MPPPELTPEPASESPTTPAFTPARLTLAKLAALEKLITGEQVLAFQQLIQRVPVPDHIYDTAVDLVRMTRPADESAPAWVKNIQWTVGVPRMQNYPAGVPTMAEI